MAPKGAVFVPISQFPIKKIRKDCTYLSTPAMKIPETMQNIHACEVTRIASVVNPLNQIWGGKKKENIGNILTDRGFSEHDLVYLVHWQNWLPRRVMSAWRIGGILHALEGWTVHECGDAMVHADKAWSAAIRHGFVPLTKAWKPAKPGGSVAGACDRYMYANLDAIRRWLENYVSAIGSTNSPPLQKPTYMVGVMNDDLDSNSI